MDCRNLVIEQGQRESGVDCDLLLLLDQFIEALHGDPRQPLHGAGAIDRHADQVLALGGVKRSDWILHENRTSLSCCET